MIRPLALLAALVVALAPVPAVAAPVTGPALGTSPAVLAAALTCTPDIDHPSRTPVLLVHGTGVDAASNFETNYWLALPRLGYPTCLVSLPDKAMGDLQTSAEDVVSAIRTMSTRSGRKISAIGHSQGGTLLFWALRFWPDLASQLDDVITWGAPAQGTLDSNIACLPLCAPALWQMRAGSAFNAALTRAPVPAGPSYSNLISLTDEISTPQPLSSAMPGAGRVILQARCAGRVVGHIGMAMDAEVYALTMDALTHAGPADPLRIPLGTCLKAYGAGFDQITWNRKLAAGLLDFATEVLENRTDRCEPPLQAYARV